MKNTIQFYYNIYPENIVKIKDDVYSFYVDYDKYFFVKVNRPLKDIEEIYEIVSSDKNYHTFIPNKFSSILTEDNKNYYVLLKMSGPENIDIDITDVIRNMRTYVKKNSILNRTNWGELWENKVDYLEYQVSELSTTHKIVRSSFSYYIGLAENAITYFNMLNPIDTNTVLAHKRLKYPLTTKDLYNPLDLVLDYKARDIASYLKAKFFNEYNPIKEVQILANKNLLTSLEYNLLFCRLLYPSYYFDKLESIFEQNQDEEILLKYINKTDEYEKFLNEVFQIFKNKSSMIKIDWLIKKS